MTQTQTQNHDNTVHVPRKFFENPISLAVTMSSKRVY